MSSCFVSKFGGMLKCVSVGYWPAQKHQPPRLDRFQINSHYCRLWIVTGIFSKVTSIKSKQVNVLFGDVDSPNARPRSQIQDLDREMFVRRDGTGFVVARYEEELVDYVHPVQLLLLKGQHVYVDAARDLRHQQETNICPASIFHTSGHETAHSPGPPHTWVVRMVCVLSVLLIESTTQ